MKAAMWSVLEASDGYKDIWPDRVVKRVAQRAAEFGRGDLKYVARHHSDTRGEAQRGRAEVVDVDVAWPAESGVLEVVMLDVGDGVGHVGFAG